jgi:HAE1 family hydrophobic/amphiphilic exporter-1
VRFNGERRRSIQLRLNTDRLTAYGQTVDQVRDAIERQNVEIPGGTFIAGKSEIALRTMGRLQEVRDFDRIIISQRDGQVITFGDVGFVEDTVQEIRSVAGGRTAFRFTGNRETNRDEYGRRQG